MPSNNTSVKSVNQKIPEEPATVKNSVLDFGSFEFSSKNREETLRAPRPFNLFPGSSISTRMHERGAMTD
jgi:hypothetical protein